MAERIYNMMTSSKGIIFRVTGHLCGEFTGHRWIPRTKASDAEFWCFLWSAPEKRLSKQSRGLWFETPSCSFWRHRNDMQFNQRTIHQGVTAVSGQWCMGCRGLTGYVALILSFFNAVPSDICRDHSGCAPNPWKTTLHCNVVSHWLGIYTKWSLYMVASRHDNTFLITGPSWGNPPVPYKRPVMPTIVVSPKEPMNKQSRCRWF